MLAQYYENSPGQTSTVLVSEIIKHELSKSTSYSIKCKTCGVLTANYGSILEAETEFLAHIPRAHGR